MVLSILFVMVLLAIGVIAEAQQPKKVPRIGYLGNTASGQAGALGMETFRERLRELGYIEGQNITIEPRYWEGKVERLPDLAAELVRLNCDVILTTGTEAAQTAKNVIKTIPVVMAFGSDAVRRGITEAQIGRDRDSTRPRRFRERLSNRKQKQLGAIMMSAGTRFFAERKRIVELAGKYGLPAIYLQKEFVDEGGLMFYGADYTDLYRRAAVYVDKILKGAKPADLPVQQATKFEFVINLKAAKQIGLTIPVRVLGRVNRVIK